MKKIIVAFLIFISAFMYKGEILSYAASDTKSIKMGNIMYKKGKFDEALKYYNKAKIDAPNSAIVNFNTGTALYKKREYKKAIDSFISALSSAGPKLESKINYNIANAKYRMGRNSVSTDLQKSINLYRDALSYYKRSIDLNSHDMNAKYNHELVERELKILLDKLKHQKASSKGEKSSHNKNSSHKNGTLSSNPGNQKESKSASTVSGQKRKEGERKKKANVNKAEQFQPKAPGGVDNKKEMSEKEARMILNRYSEEELSHSSINGTKRFEYPPVDKDW